MVLSVYLANTEKNRRLNSYEKAPKRAHKMRSLCKICKIRPVAVNYHKNGRTFYRSKCDHCAKSREHGLPRWHLAGYRMKPKCDKCGFESKFREQFNVFYIDGNPSNCKHTNLKTVCANCQRILHILKLPWRQGDLIPDF